MLVNDLDDITVMQLTSIKRLAKDADSTMSINLEQMILSHLKVVSRQINSRLQKLRRTKRKNLTLSGDSITGARASKLASFCYLALVLSSATRAKPVWVRGRINQRIPNRLDGLVDFDFG